MFRPPGANRLPTGTGAARPVLVHAPTTVASPSGSYRIKLVWSVPSTRPTSAVIAAKVSCRRGPFGDQRRHPAQRGLLVFAAPPLGDVAPDRVHETLGEYRAGAPLKPAHPAVGAQVAGLELAHVLTEFVRVESLQGARSVVGMNELDEGSRHELRVRVAERSFEGLIDTGEVAVEAGDAEQVEGEFEEVAELPLGPLASAFHVGESRHGVVDAREQLRPGSLERRDVCAMSQTVVSRPRRVISRISPARRSTVTCRSWNAAATWPISSRPL